MKALQFEHLVRAISVVFNLEYNLEYNIEYGVEYKVEYNGQENTEGLRELKIRLIKLNTKKIEEFKSNRISTEGLSTLTNINTLKTELKIDS